MKHKTLYELGFFALLIGLAGCDRQVSFADDVQPIFTEYCLECHDGTGEGIVASGFSVRDYDGVMTGTTFGPTVVAGSSMSSALYLVVAQKTAPEIHMPPHHDESLAEGRRYALSEDQVEVIGTWIDQGAKDN